MTEATTTDDDEVQPEDVINGSRLARDWEPEDWRQAYRNAGSVEEANDVAQAFKLLDSGRWWDMCQEVHKVFGCSDKSGREAFAEAHPQMVEWASVWGLCEHMARFPRHTEASEERLTFRD